MNPSSPNQAHLAKVAAFYDGISLPSAPSRAYRREIAVYYKAFVPPGASVLEIGCGDGSLLASLPNRDVHGADISASMISKARENVPHGVFHVVSGEQLNLDRTFDCIILSDVLNLCYDVQELLQRLHSVSHPGTRLIINVHNFLWMPVLRTAEFFGWKTRQPANNWLSKNDVATLCELAGWEVHEKASKMLCPFSLFGLGRFINRFIAPFCGPLCLSSFLTARKCAGLAKRNEDVSVTVVIPARNEAGNIPAAVARMPRFGRSLEIVFVEGGSSDDTWDAIERTCSQETPGIRTVCLKQAGKGKGDAVRAGFAVATGDLLMILDADLTMPPEELPKFYNAIVSGECEFANGSRLVYPMESQAMQFLNFLANHLFAISFSWVMAQNVKDTLCGTKVLYRSDYERIANQRNYFGEVDPFGDFDLLFGADKLGLKILDIPVHYKDRKYGTTNIQRWRHGLLLFKMLFLGARKLKFI